MSKYCVCEMESYFDEAFDGTLCRVKRVLQVFNNEADAQDAMACFDPMRFGDYETVIRCVPSEELNETFR